mmetsp:Transcript_5944/g.20251  ORF Transcript_5944/g.20251 Transcript_5944/m.20251 type:complete len:247 (+) Transcript_5944:3014-3754(+)
MMTVWGGAGGALASLGWARSAAFFGGSMMGERGVSLPEGSFGDWGTSTGGGGRGGAGGSGGLTEVRVVRRPVRPASGMMLLRSTSLMTLWFFMWLLPMDSRFTSLGAASGLGESGASSLPLISSDCSSLTSSEPFSTGAGAASAWEVPFASTGSGAGAGAAGGSSGAEPFVSTTIADFTSRMASGGLATTGGAGTGGACSAGATGAGAGTGSSTTMASSMTLSCRREGSQQASSHARVCEKHRSRS